MSGLLEDVLTDADVAAIEAVLSSKIFRFDKLVKIAGLDPGKAFQDTDLRCLDLRGADLRGFDFTGSDLRQCVINGRTLIDNSTIFENTKLDWIESDDLPIVQRMQEIETASTSERRQDLLNELISEHGRTEHVVAYMVKAAANAKELGHFLDFFVQLPADLTADQFAIVRNQGKELFARKRKQAKSRTRREKTAIFAVEPILNRLKEGAGDMGKVVFGYLSEVMNSKPQTVALEGTALVEVSDIEKAFSRIGQI